MIQVYNISGTLDSNLFIQLKISSIIRISNLIGKPTWHCRTGTGNCNLKWTQTVYCFCLIIFFIRTQRPYCVNTSLRYVSLFQMIQHCWIFPTNNKVVWIYVWKKFVWNASYVMTFLNRCLIIHFTMNSVQFYWRDHFTTKQWLKTVFVFQSGSYSDLI